MFPINQQHNSIPVNGQNQCFREQGRQYLRGPDWFITLWKRTSSCFGLAFFSANTIVLPWWKQIFIDFIEGSAYLRSMTLVFYFGPLQRCHHWRGFVYCFLFSFFPQVLHSFVIRNSQNSIWLLSDSGAVSRCCQGTLSRDHFTLSQLFPLPPWYLVCSSDHRGCCHLLVGK